MNEPRQRLLERIRAVLLVACIGLPFATGHARGGQAPGERTQADIGDWHAAGRQLLALVNAARAQARYCGTRRFDAARPLAWSDALGAAAHAHSRDMAQRDHVSHEGPQGRRMGDRATAAGYAWQRIGENIAAGMRSPQRVVSRWIASPHHCSNLMDPHFTDMGAAYAVDPESAFTTYWTQVLGTPRPCARTRAADPLPRR